MVFRIRPRPRPRPRPTWQQEEDEDGFEQQDWIGHDHEHDHCWVCNCFLGSEWMDGCMNIKPILQVNERIQMGESNTLLGWIRKPTPHLMLFTHR